MIKKKTTLKLLAVITMALKFNVNCKFIDFDFLEYLIFQLKGNDLGWVNVFLIKSNIMFVT